MLGRYVATELWLELGRYVAAERDGGSVATPSGGQQKVNSLQKAGGNLRFLNAGVSCIPTFAANSQAGETLSPGSGIDWFRADSGSCCLDYRRIRGAVLGKEMTQLQKKRQMPPTYSCS
ncbi:hypothetical protein DY000_02021685 [Brassica cretica]|uniref:Uncharacterized protein n=1 Tax=Brassica cretica TaxID=69181 RepID=A0ABQ7E7E2_BRACR|nr:hypothetical protein DY000_02021685 [Brassica cretica]